MPQAQGAVLQLQAQLPAGVVTFASDRLATDQRVSSTPSPALVNVPEQLPELRGRWCLLDGWLMREGCTSGTARGERCPERGVGVNGYEASVFRGPPIGQLLHEFSRPDPVLLGVYGGFIP